MIKNFKSVGVLVVICSIVALLLACTNQITDPIIKENAKKAASKALREVLPSGKIFDEVDISKYTLPESVQEVHKETSGKGYVIKLSVNGYGPDMVIMCGVDADNVVTGAKCLSSNETKSVEKTYGNNFAGKDLAGVEAVDIIAGTTVTTEAYKGAVKDAVNTAIILGGGEADLRSPEEIFNDNLKAALPEADEFVKQAVVDAQNNISFIYAAKNGVGYVYVIDDKTFIGMDTEGNVVTEGITEENSAIAQSMAQLAATQTKVDTAGADISARITAVQKTAEGNYVIEIDGLGFAYNGNPTYHIEGKEIPIKICVVLTPDGTILKCLTVSHQESAGYGAVCGEESYYSQFDGKTAETYTDVDIVGSPTYSITNNGYLQAIERCFKAVEILEGGAK